MAGFLSTTPVEDRTPDAVVRRAILAISAVGSTVLFVRSPV
ncbi:MAG: hypothetical protein R3290_06460 [Acidimicrobiia bacterium]|nr:hypothetical protein [Acidimicrobiia bacterium]